MHIVPGLIAAVVLLTIFVLFVVSFCAIRGLFHFSALLPEFFTESYFIRSSYLALGRVLVLVYAVFILIYSASLFPEQSFRYYTIWSYTLLVLYFLCASVNSLLKVRYGDDYLRDLYHYSAGYSLWCRVTWVLFVIFVTNVLLVDVVLWTILYPHARDQGKSSQVINFSSINVHAVNFLFMLFEAFFSMLPLFATSVVFVIIPPLAYLFFLWISMSLGGSLTYFFMDPSKDDAPLWYLGVFLLHVIFFYLGYFLIRLRNRFAPQEYARLEEQSLLRSSMTMV